jgi:hypothetical protein
MQLFGEKKLMICLILFSEFELEEYFMREHLRRKR